MNKVTRHLTKLAATLVLIGPSFGYGEPSVESWVGRYHYDECGPAIGKEVSGGQGIVPCNEHRIQIMKAGQVLTTTVHDTGYQADLHVQCKTKVSGDRLELIFDKELPPSVPPCCDENEHLLTLIRSRGRLLTKWQWFEPNWAGDNYKNPGVYFTKE